MTQADFDQWLHEFTLMTDQIPAAIEVDRKAWLAIVRALASDEAANLSFGLREMAYATPSGQVLIRVKAGRG